MIKFATILTRNTHTKQSDEPSSLKEAMRRLDWQNWKNTMAVEYLFLIENEKESLSESPHNQKVISGQRVFNLKKNREEKILKYKARLVVHCYKQ